MTENEEKNFKQYVKKEFHEEFQKQCEKNSLDFYSCGCILTAHLVMGDLMQHTYKGVWKKDKATPGEVWGDAMKQTNYHSGASAAFTAIMVAKYSPRGEEFKEWCKKEGMVMVKWD